MFGKHGALCGCERHDGEAVTMNIPAIDSLTEDVHNAMAIFYETPNSIYNSIQEQHPN